MISLLKGTVLEQTKSGVILLCGSVGYGVSLTNSDQASLIKDNEATLYIYEHVKEDAHDLYGFTSTEGKQLFERLLSVTGVGPKMAVSILNIGRAGALRTAIATGDTKYLASASGVGKKVAERIVVDLKDKVGEPTSEDATDFLRQANNQDDEAAQALLALGYSPEDAAQMLRGVDSSLSSQQRIKAALKGGA